jgi:hypothetical protein
MLLAGKDGSGKSSALVSLAAFVQLMTPDAAFYVIDAENKLASVLKTWGDDAPQNLVYFRCPDMNAVTDATAEILDRVQPGDWCAAESMSRIWEKAQNLGYNAVTGMDKVAWMEKRQAHVREHGRQGAPAVTPRPDDLWSITKGAHDGAFLELLSQHPTLNVLLTTTIAKPPKPDAFIKESEARAEGMGHDFLYGVPMNGISVRLTTLCGCTQFRVIDAPAPQTIEVPIAAVVNAITGATTWRNRTFKLALLSGEVAADYIESAVP